MSNETAGALQWGLLHSPHVDLAGWHQHQDVPDCEPPSHSSLSCGIFKRAARERREELALCWQSKIWMLEQNLLRVLAVVVLVVLMLLVLLLVLVLPLVLALVLL